MSDSDSDGSSSYDESESSSERAWTCDDIYPATKNEKAKGATVDESSSGSYDSDSNSSASAPVKTRRNHESKSTVKTVDSSDSSDSDGRAPKAKASARPTLQRHSSADIEAVIKGQEDVLAKAEIEEKKRQLLINKNKESLRQRSEEALSISRHLEEELNNLSEEFDSSDDALKELEEKLERKRNSSHSIEKRREQKDKFERRNIEREMRLAKARERIEKKKAEEAKQEEQKIIDERNVAGKLDMTKPARVERAYSWYTRMAMPSRDKMKQRVEFMPASSGVTPDDVDLLPWNARGTFVSVAAMMRMNRTASQSGNKGATSAKSTSESDSDSD
jgi:hypothetical protein